MFNEAHDAMKYDNRLRTRRDWVSPDELATELAALPDSADKALAPGEEPEPKPSAEAAAPPTPEAPEAPAPTFGEPAADTGLPQPTASFGGDAEDSKTTLGDAFAATSTDEPGGMPEA